VMVTPPVPIKINVTPTDLQAPVGGLQQFTAITTLSDKTTLDVTGSATWSSSDSTVATVRGTGLATAKGIGTAEISATSNIKGSANWMILPGPTRSKYLRTTFSSSPTAIVYDAARKLIFANEPDQNRVDVIAGPDYDLSASVSLPAPSS